MPDVDGDPVVSYSLKELLFQFSGALARIEDKVDRKADDATVGRLFDKVDAKADRADVMKLGERMDELDRWRARMVGIAIGATVGGGAFGGGVVAAALRLFGHG